MNGNGTALAFGLNANARSQSCGRAYLPGKEIDGMFVSFSRRQCWVKFAAEYRVATRASRKSGRFAPYQLTTESNDRMRLANRSGVAIPSSPTISMPVDASE